MNVPQLLGIGLRLLALHLISLALQLLALQTLMVQQHEISPLLQFAFPRWGFALPLLLLPPAIWLLFFPLSCARAILPGDASQPQAACIAVVALLSLFMFSNQLQNLFIWLQMFTINLDIPLNKLPRALASAGTWQLLLPFSLLLFLLRTRLARRLFAAG